MNDNIQTEISTLNRIKFAIKSVWYILRGKDILVTFFDDASMYIRCTPQRLSAVAEVIGDINKSVEFEAADQWYRDLLDMHTIRRN